MVDPETSSSVEERGEKVHVISSTSSRMVAVRGVPLSEMRVAKVREFEVNWVSNLSEKLLCPKTAGVLIGFQLKQLTDPQWVQLNSALTPLGEVPEIWVVPPTEFKCSTVMAPSAMDFSVTESLLKADSRTAPD